MGLEIQISLGYMMNYREALKTFRGPLLGLSLRVEDQLVLCYLEEREGPHSDLTFSP